MPRGWVLLCSRQRSCCKQLLSAQRGGQGLDVRRSGAERAHRYDLALCLRAVAMPRECHWPPWLHAECKRCKLCRPLRERNV